MVNLDNPLTYENSFDPWIMGARGEKKTLELNGQKISAEYLWTLNSEQRKQCLEDVFQHYRKNGFPYEILTDDELRADFKKLCDFDEDKVINSEGLISNSGSLCLGVCRHFCKDLFWATRSPTMDSYVDIFNDDDLLKKVLKNRMGWNATTEEKDGVKKQRPYMFSISDEMLRCGIRNSGLGFGVSNFRPSIAKWIYKHISKQYFSGESISIYDYSEGWGARFLAALACGYSYCGVDPNTSDCIQKMIDFYSADKSKYMTSKQGSEEALPREFHKVNCAVSCPAYFNMEVYSDDPSQCYNKFSQYDAWIEKFWRETVKNAKSIMAEDGVFCLIMKDQNDRLSLETDMLKVLQEEGFELKETWQYKTSKNHLSGKAKSKITTKNSEHVLFCKRVK